MKASECVPGNVYVDEAGTPWLYATNGQWYDHTGETSPADMNWMLDRVGVKFTPLVPVAGKQEWVF